MKTKVLLLIFFLTIFSCSNQENNLPKLGIQNNNNSSITEDFLNLTSNKNEILSTEKSNQGIGNEFKFNYVYSGLGSGMGKKGPRFKINGNHFLKTEQQNSSWTGEYDEKIDTICKGQISWNAIDSIKTIANQIEQSNIDRFNPDVSSGGIHNISISFAQKKINFTLKNSSHPQARDIIDIINSNIPKKCGNLFLWEEKNECNSETFTFDFSIE